MDALPFALSYDPAIPQQTKPQQEHKIALQFSYMGHNYGGLNFQPDYSNTVEEKLFDALRRTHLCRFEKISSQAKNISSSERTVNYETPPQFSRCGRTDRGVSAFQNVVSLMVRSKGWETGAKDHLPKSNTAKEYDYVRLLNRVLPIDIRVRAWAPVSKDFDARFSCIARTYRYYFFVSDLSLDRMQCAARYFVGTHNFRNFCQLNSSTNSFIRNISEFNLVVEQCPTNGQAVAYFHIKGKAFLYHQVRCMMSVLFLVGRGLERPDIVQQLLDPQIFIKKPVYKLADEHSLCLWFCEFNSDPPIQWRKSNFSHPSLGKQRTSEPLSSNLWWPVSMISRSHDHTQGYGPILVSSLIRVKIMMDMEIQTISLQNTDNVAGHSEVAENLTHVPLSCRPFELEHTEFVRRLEVRTQRRAARNLRSQS